MLHTDQRSRSCRLAAVAIAVAAFAQCLSEVPAAADGVGPHSALILGLGDQARPAVIQRATERPVDWRFRYAKAIAAVPVFDEAAGQRVGTLSAFGRWVAYDDLVTLDGDAWVRLAAGGWSPVRALRLVELPTFRGVNVPVDFDGQIGFFLEDAAIRYRPKEDVPPIVSLPRFSAVWVRGDRDVDGVRWLEVGDGAWVPARSVRLVPWNPAPAMIDGGERWIDVDLGSQTLVAYEGARPVFATLISSGLPHSPTWRGVSRIWMKRVYGKMSGGDASIPGDYYWLDSVPYTMYFHADYGLHAAYWHTDFGRPKSHGCVNMSPADAAWLFDWTAPALPEDEITLRSTPDMPGTAVWTHS